MLQHLSSSLNRILNNYVNKSNDIIKNITHSLSGATDSTNVNWDTHIDGNIDSIVNECSEYSRYSSHCVAH